MDHRNNCCGPKTSLRQVVEMLTKSEALIAMVVDDDQRLVGCVTDGDIRRALLANVSMDSPVEGVMNAHPRVLNVRDADQAHALMRKHSLKQVPLVDDEGRVAGLRIWKEILGVRLDSPARDNPVFVMAGGKGTRLAPLTRIIPKPLVPLGEKTVIEQLMDRFVDEGFSRFILSVNYKAEMIRGYFAENGGYDVRFVQETEFLGTAGSLRLGREMLDRTFFVINCDVLSCMDFSGALETHRKSGDDVTMVGVLKNWKIPYGVINLEDGKFAGVTEKPEFDFLVNGGIYVMEPHVVDLIADGESLGMPDLIERAKGAGLSIGVYPVSCDWVDIGEIDEYRKMFNQFGFTRE